MNKIIENVQSKEFDEIILDTQRQGANEVENLFKTIYNKLLTLDFIDKSEDFKKGYEYGLKAFYVVLKKVINR
jgi:hypothetical protein